MSGDDADAARATTARARARCVTTHLRHQDWAVDMDDAAP
eukprot:CAMPEP_0182575984 /NCGR_PEP_ID=MMETSP1324-20130603/32180_1 /TAXON_ID=236786 /ORGANISM="Florenciella sp., Strain RCC1587" /LENGTH=39 /DNA_ID= /DNA_START= /DNA_END= /DNA_ORIENTATION=